MIISFITRFFRCLDRTVRIQRCECLLPLTYNDGTAIEQEKFDQTTQELSNRFDGLTQDVVHSHGLWKSAGLVYRDELVRLRIDSRERAAKAFFQGHKEIWKARFGQLDLWITMHEVEVI
jgi:hypothetical protein